MPVTAFLTALLCFASIITYRLILVPAFFSPLAKLPHAHWSSRFSNIWIRYKRYGAAENKAIEHAHKRLGPIVRLGSTEVSVNSVEGLKEVYNGNSCDRDPWYSRVYHNYGIQNMFSFAERRPHAIRRRMLGSVYSKSSLHSSQDIPYFAQVLIKERLLPLVKSRMESEGSVNVLPLCLAFATDFICSYIFGLQNIPDFLRQEQERAQWLAAHEKSKNAGFWPGECPALTKNLHRMGIKLVPDEAARCREEVRQLCPQLMSRLERNDNLQEWNGLRRTEPTVYDQVAQNLLPTITQHDETKEHPVLLPRMSLASELMDHIKAGTETSGWSLVYVLHELSLRPEIQERLHQEIASVTELGLADVTPFSVDTTKSLDKLPLLDAILLETIRLHPAVAGSQPRIAPASVKKLGQDIPFSINGYLIPPGTRVSAQAYSLHRNEKVFPNAEVWDPNRWLNAQSDERSEMKRWFWGFGSGPMMCVGNSFAILELKYVVASIYSNFRTQVVLDDCIEQVDGYSSGPAAKEILLNFIPRQD